LYKIGKSEISPQCTLKKSFSSYKGTLYGKRSVHEIRGPIVSTKWRLITCLKRIVVDVRIRQYHLAQLREAIWDLHLGGHRVCRIKAVCTFLFFFAKNCKIPPKKNSPVTCKLGFEGKKPDFKPESDHGKLCHHQIWYFSSRSIAFIEMLLSSSILQIVLKWQAMSPSSSFTLVDFFPFLTLNLSHSFY